MIQKGRQLEGSAMPVEISCANFAEMGHSDAGPLTKKKKLMN
jgi:hypothetical protein